MEKRILLNGIVRGVVTKEKDHKAYAHTYQVEIDVTDKGRMAFVDLMDWGEKQKFNIGENVLSLPCRVAISDFSGDIEFTTIQSAMSKKNNEPDVPADLSKKKVAEVRI